MTFRKFLVFLVIVGLAGWSLRSHLNSSKNNGGGEKGFQAVPWISGTQKNTVLVIGPT